jgi:HupH hydrogenase expression protein, C-terminal conserved region
MSSLEAIGIRVETATGNLVPLLHEIRHALARLVEDSDGDGTTIDLRSLPLAPGEEARIDEILGQGEVRAEMSALGLTLVQESVYPGAWLITHRNADDEIVARFIEVTRMPAILMSQREDIVQGIEALENKLQELNT